MNAKDAEKLNERIELPADPETLDKRIDRLMLEPLPSLSERLELAGILRLRKDGELVYWQLRNMVAVLQRIAPECESLDNSAVARAWTNIQYMAHTNTLITDSEEIDGIVQHGVDSVYRHRVQEWLAYVMPLLGSVTSNSGPGVPPHRAVDDLPSGLVAEVRTEAKRDWFGSLAATGQALWNHSVLNSKASRADLLLAMEWGARESLRELKHATAEDEKQRIRLRLEFFWLLLKGGAYAAGANALFHPELACLISRESAVGAGKAINDITSALTYGLEALVCSHNWGGAAGAASQEVDTSEVIAVLCQQAEEAHTQANRYHR